MVYREGKLLAAIGIPIGLIVGNMIGYFLIPDGWYWLTTLCVTAGVGFFTFMIVMISIHTPVKKAAAISPMEALRYSDYQGKLKESSMLHREITPLSLAKMNLSRQKLKSVLTILSLSIGGVLVVLISTMLVSYDGVAEARYKDFPVGEFNIQLNANQSWETAGVSLAGLQQKDFLNTDFVNAVESMSGRISGSNFSERVQCSRNTEPPFVKYLGDIIEMEQKIHRELCHLVVLKNRSVKQSNQSAAGRNASFSPIGILITVPGRRLPDGSTFQTVLSTVSMHRL